MTFLTAETRVFDAHFPRFDRTSTIQPFDRLQVVGKIYTDQRPESNSARKLSDKKPANELFHLVFLHAVGFTKECWEPWIEYFFNTFGKSSIGTVLSLDAVNHGESYLLNKDKLGLTSSWEDAAKDVLKILSQLGIVSNVIVIGHSMGGATALHAAALEKRVIDSVVAIEPVAYSDPTVAMKGPVRKQVFGFFEKVNKYIKDTFPDEKAFQKYMVTGGIARTVDPRVRDALFKYAKYVKNDGDGDTSDSRGGAVIAIPPRESLMTSYGSSYLSTVNMPHILKTVDCQVCHVVGLAATWNPPASVEAIRSALPYCVPVGIEGGQHLVAMERPKDTFDAVKPFILNRIKVIHQRAQAENEGRIDNKAQAQEYFWNTYDKFKEEYLSNRLMKYDRVSKL